MFSFMFYFGRWSVKGCDIVFWCRRPSSAKRVRRSCWPLAKCGEIFFAPEEAGPGAVRREGSEEARLVCSKCMHPWTAAALILSLPLRC